MAGRDRLLRDVGEFGLIEWVRTHGPHLPASVLIGPGDDSAVLRWDPRNLLLATTDLLVEETDFTWVTSPPEAIGAKALAVNLSDIGAMGGRPRYALLSVALPSKTPMHRVRGMIRGFWREATGAAVGVIGGDLSEGPLVSVNATVLGEAQANRVVSRSGAGVGDRIWVTGQLGAAAAGLWLLQHGVHLKGASLRGTGIGRLSPGDRRGLIAAIRAQQRPVARWREGHALAAAGLVNAMIDLSDGLAADLGHLCKASGVGARVLVDQVPVAASARIVAARAGLHPTEFAVTGGEDFELLFTSAASPARLERFWKGRGFGHLTQIGEVTAGTKVQLINPRGRARPLVGGFSHFRPRRLGAGDRTAGSSPW